MTERLTALTAGIERPDDRARAEARAEAGADAGRLGELAGRLAGGVGTRARALVLADEASLRTTSLATDVGVQVRPVGRRQGEPLAVDQHDACSPEKALDAVLAGVDLVDQEVDTGADLLVLVLPAADLAVPSAALIGLLTGFDASAVTATGQDDEAWMRDCAATREAMRRGRRVMTGTEGLVGLLAAIGGADLALAVGVLLGAASRRTSVVLDGPACAAAALVAARLAFRAPDWWVHAHVSPDPAHALALARLSSEAVLDLRLRSQDGTGALLAVPVLRAAATLTE